MEAAGAAGLLAGLPNEKGDAEGAVLAGGFVPNVEVGTAGWGAGAGAGVGARADAGAEEAVFAKKFGTPSDGAGTAEDDLAGLL